MKNWREGKLFSSIHRMIEKHGQGEDISIIIAILGIHIANIIIFASKENKELRLKLFSSIITALEKSRDVDP